MDIDLEIFKRGLKFITDDMPKKARMKYREYQREREYERRTGLIEMNIRKKELDIEKEKTKLMILVEKRSGRKNHGHR